MQAGCIPAHSNQISITCYTHLPYYCRICASNKYAPQMPHIFHIPKLLHMHQREKDTNIYIIYELTDINHVTSSTVHTVHKCQQQRRYRRRSTTMMPQAIKYTEFATWSNQSKTELERLTFDPNIYGDNIPAISNIGQNVQPLKSDTCF